MSRTRAERAGADERGKFLTGFGASQTARERFVGREEDGWEHHHLGRDLVRLRELLAAVHALRDRRPRGERRGECGIAAVHCRFELVRVGCAVGPIAHFGTPNDDILRSRQTPVGGNRQPLRSALHGDVFAPDRRAPGEHGVAARS